MSTHQNPKAKTPAELAEEKRLADEAEAKRQAELGGQKQELGFLDVIGSFLKMIFSMLFGDKGVDEGVSEDANDPNAAPMTNSERLSIGKTVITSNVAKKWESYKAAHKGEAVSLTSPVEGDAKVTSGFGHRHAPKAGASTDHKGIDLSAPNGSDKILAAADGLVLFSDRAGSSGNTLIIGHADGTSTIYRHLKYKNDMPATGTTVAQGALVGTMGNTGNSTGKHLHFEYRDANGVAQAPHITGSSIAKGAVVAAGGHEHTGKLPVADATHASLPAPRNYNLTPQGNSRG